MLSYQYHEYNYLVSIDEFGNIKTIVSFDTACTLPNMDKSDDIDTFGIIDNIDTIENTYINMTLIFEASYILNVSI